MAPSWRPQKVEDFGIPVEFDACWTPPTPPPRSRPDQNDIRGWGPLSLHWGI
eukprot:gene19171-biopygen14542